jgi:hypothetical protein
MKHKTTTFKDAEAVAAWLNRKHGSIELVSLTPGQGSKLVAIYRELPAPETTDIPDDQEFLAARADALIAASSLRLITLAELTNSVRNLKRYNDFTLAQIRNFVFNQLATTNRYVIEPNRRGYTIQHA